MRSKDGSPDVCYLGALWVEEKLCLKKCYEELVNNVDMTNESIKNHVMVLQ